jgi:integrase
MHLEQRADGPWRAVVQHRGRRARTSWLPSRAEAHMRGAELLLELGATPRDAVDVDVLVTSHLAALEERLAATTFADYVAVVERLRRDAPVFLERQVADVTPVVVEAVYRQLARAGWSPHRLNRLHDVLSTGWRRAARYGWASVNPLREVQRPRIDRGEISPPATEDVARLLAAAPLDFRLYLRLAATLGARRGELVALQWQDVRFELGEVVIRRSQAYTARGGVQTRDGKTGRKGHRVVSLGAATMGMLRRHRAVMVEAALMQGLPDPVWVFSLDAGVTPWRPDYATTRLARLRVERGLPHVNTKALRHYVATELLAAGESPVQVAGRLGHTTPATTLKVYAHWVRARDRSAADRLDEQLG